MCKLQFFMATVLSQWIGAMEKLTISNICFLASFLKGFSEKG